MGLILDSSLLVAEEREKFALSEWLRSRPPEPVAVSAITVFELWFGIEVETNAARAKRRRRWSTTTRPAAAKHFRHEGRNEPVCPACHWWVRTERTPSKVKHIRAEAMTLMQVEKRVKALEKTILRLVGPKPIANRKWYRTQAGHFSHDPAFDEIVKLGRTYRKSLRLRSDSKRP